MGAGGPEGFETTYSPLKFPLNIAIIKDYETKNVGREGSPRIRGKDADFDPFEKLFMKAYSSHLKWR